MDFYEKNIETIERHHPYLLEGIDSHDEDEGRIRIKKEEAGALIVSFIKKDGEEILIHGAFDQQKSANQVIEMLGSMGKEGIAVVFGLGLGYLAEEFLKNRGKGHVLLIYEATPALFKMALKAKDMTHLFSAEKVRFIVGDKIDSISAIHEFHHHIAFGRFWVIKHNPSVRVNEAAYDRFFKRLLDEKRMSDTNVATVINIGKEFINAFIENIPSIIRSPGVKGLKDIFAGRPAIVVSAGPSLEKNIHLLKKAKGRAVIIAVDPVLPTLVPAGIIPDIVVAIDPMAENIKVFEGNPLLKEIPFVCLMQYTKDIMQMYPGPIFMNSVPGNIVYQWLKDYWEEKGYIETFGGSVAHLAFATAQYVGAKTICFVGQDLSFEKKLHAVDISDILASFHEKDAPDSTKGAVEALDIFGEKRYTMTSFLVFKTSFEDRIREFDGTVVNCTEGGLHIEGTKDMRLIDFLEGYCQGSGLDTYSILRGLFESDVSYNLDGLLFQVKTARQIFSDIRMNASKILKYIHKARRLRQVKREDEEVRGLVEKIEDLSKTVKHPILDIIAAYHYQLELYLKRPHIMEVDEIKDPWERLDAQLVRGLNYYGELIDAITLFTKELDILIKRLKREQKVNAIMMDDAMDKLEQCIMVARLYKKAGNICQAVRYFEKAVGLQKEKAGIKKGIPVFLDLAELYIKQFRYPEAERLLEDLEGSTGQNLLPQQKEKIASMLGICRDKMVSWQKRVEKMEGLLKNAEANYGGRLESGYFYFRIRDYEQAERAYQRAIEEMTTNGFAKEAADQAKQLSAAYYGLAHTYIAMERMEKGVEVIEKAIEVEPNNPIFYRDLGLIAIQNNDVTAAEAFLNKAIELAPEDERLYKLLGDIYLQTGYAQKAILLYEEAIKRNSVSQFLKQELAFLYKEIISGGKGRN